MTVDRPFVRAPICRERAVLRRAEPNELRGRIAGRCAAVEIDDVYVGNGCLRRTDLTPKLNELIGIARQIHVVYEAIRLIPRERKRFAF